MAEELPELQERYLQFIEERNWGQFHTPQNVAMALSVEANELLECFLWKDNPSSEALQGDPELVSDVEEEVADVLIYAMSLANEMEIDLLEAIEQKLSENEQRFTSDESAEIRQQLEQWQRR